MKVFLTALILSAALATFAQYWDVRKRHSYHSDDGGWTTSYCYDIKARQQSWYMNYIAIGISLGGILFLIWTY